MRGVNSCPVLWTRAKACLHGLGPCRIHNDHVVGTGEVKLLGGQGVGSGEDRVPVTQERGEQKPPIPLGLEGERGGRVGAGARGQTDCGAARAGSV